MGIFTRFSDIVNSNINAILDKAEDPEKIVRLMIQEMEDTLVEVRSAAARSIADKKDLNRKIEALDREKDDWDDKAELALRKGREDLAKAALVEKSRVKTAVDVLKEDYVAVDEGLSKLNEDIARLEAKLEDAKARQKALPTRPPFASSTMRASCAVREIGAAARAVTIARATRAACVSSPYRCSTRFNSRSSTSASHSRADVPCCGSMRMSSGPSRRKLKPRCASSSCGEETPRSKRSPSIFPTSARSSMTVSSCAISALTSSKRGSSTRDAGADAMASGSRSIATSRPESSSRSNIALLCPPRPNVPST